MASRTRRSWMPRPAIDWSTRRLRSVARSLVRGCAEIDRVPKGWEAAAGGAAWLASRHAADRATRAVESKIRSEELSVSIREIGCRLIAPADCGIPPFDRIVRESPSDR